MSLVCVKLVFRRKKGLELRSLLPIPAPRKSTVSQFPLQRNNVFLDFTGKFVVALLYILPFEQHLVHESQHSEPNQLTSQKN